MPSPPLRLGRHVDDALRGGRPVVGLETAVVTHGLPVDVAMDTLSRMEEVVREEGATPAVCLLLAGTLIVGAERGEVERAVADPNRRKVGVGELGLGAAGGWTGGLTVSGSLAAVHRAGIRVFATGGIGGVHRGDSGDVSADLPALARFPAITVCSGAKAILDIPRTLEYLETLGVPVVAYRTTRFPAFYTDGDLEVPCVESPKEIANAWTAAQELDAGRGLVVGQPLLAHRAIPRTEWDAWLESALRAATETGVTGKAVTPFLLDKVASSSGGRTVQANIELLVRNAQLAAQVAKALRAPS